MSIIIDGYNLLYASGILGRGIGPGGLERSRTALLNFIAESLEERELQDTKVVFDAREAPPGLPRTGAHRGLAVIFAPRGTEADEEIERLIAAHTSPKRLVVVSSDHRLHRAAKRRKAKPIDSDIWYHEVLRRRIERSQSGGAAAHALKPGAPPTESAVRHWLRIFGLLDEVQAEEQAAVATPEVASEPEKQSKPDQNSETEKKSTPSKKSKSAKKAEPGQAVEEIAPFESPFPPGYAEDIREEDV